MRLAIVALLLAGTAVPLLAQPADLEGRVTRVEKELRAVQRKVFPGGNPDYFEPQIAPAPAPVTPSGTPADGAISDLSARVSALEGQVRQLTNQTEVNNHRLDVLEQGFAKLQADTDYRLQQVEGGGAGAAAAAGGAGGALGAAAAGGAAGADAAPAPFGPQGRKPLPAGVKPARGGAADGGDAAASDGDGAPPAAAASPAPPKTGDGAEDGYMLGYQLWQQKRYGEAEDALKQVVAKYPNHRRASYAQNLLGRAYLDDGQLTSAADAFLTSYKRFPRGERAADSLYYLGQTLTRLKKQSQACQVYDELRDVYGATLNATLKARVAQGRQDAKCGA
ncbi:tetratricopeptide repeat protein [Sphingomonas morindae]|uniref:Tetratricopeptide repeat protein n=1 Tax=Sphingomonas morindae TaxID=1541170 RepID=A0ABY4X5U4_9SPHN|nr:tetratricopeptide repeat protein [Sphingomonas morindae]USI72277.1 tetratricopeptide repeat protein [Sphingomonas morindae]